MESNILMNIMGTVVRPIQTKEPKQQVLTAK